MLRPRSTLWVKKVTALLAAGWVFWSLTCVQNLADILGTGMALTGVAGALGPGGQAVGAVGAGLDLIVDIVRFTPIGH